MTMKEVAEHLGLNWKTVKNIHKRYLKEKFSKEDRGKPKILLVDELAIKKGHNYLTIIADWESDYFLNKPTGTSAEKSETHYYCVMASRLAIDFFLEDLAEAR